VSTEPFAPRVRRLLPAALATLAAGLLAVLAVGAPAQADPSPGEKIADALRDSPVHVGPGLEAAIPADRQQEIVAQIEEAGIPVKVVLVPLVKGGPWGGDADQLAHVVHERLGGGEMVLLTTSGDIADDVRGYDWPEGSHQARDAANAVFHQEDMNDAGLAARVERAIEIVEAGNGTEAYEEATADLRTDAPGTGGTSGTSDDGAEESSGGSAWTLPLVVGGAVLVAALGGLFLIRRGRLGRAGPDAPFASPKAVFAAARAADEETLRRRAHEEVVALGEELGDREDTTPALGRALDAYAAAGTVLDGARGLPDLAGVLALVAEGRDALHDDGGKGGGKGRKRPQQPLPLCFFHPLHGRADRTVRWRPMGRREALQVAACGTCANAVRDRRAPEVLTDTVDGRDVPYFEVPAENSLWAATGYGSLGDEPLAVRVQRGDFSRASKA
jgi:hypothetical protein